MDTGSGKTYMSALDMLEFSFPVSLTCSSSALLRIVAEMDRCPAGKVNSSPVTTIWPRRMPIPSQRIWFLAPTVDLCKQQHEFISSYLPALGTRLLIGSDGMDRWSEQRVWNAILDNIQVVVSPHDVLADALGHGFVKMTDLALLIFDEGMPSYYPQNFLHLPATRCY
jgi:hypothetical protein